MKEQTAIITTSYDGLIIVSTLCPEFDDITHDIGEFELSCFALRNSFNASNIEFFIGTASGKLFYFYNGWLQNTKEKLNEKDDEGPVTNVVCYKDIVAWSTMKCIKVIHYSRKLKICMIARPEKQPSFPDYIYASSAIKPTILWRKEEMQAYNNKIAGDYLYVSWFNILKICRLKVREDQKL